MTDLVDNEMRFKREIREVFDSENNKFYERRENETAIKNGIKFKLEVFLLTSDLWCNNNNSRHS